MFERGDYVTIISCGSSSGFSFGAASEAQWFVTTSCLTQAVYDIHTSVHDITRHTTTTSIQTCKTSGQPLDTQPAIWCLF
jgi:hypothetical protein